MPGAAAIPEKIWTTKSPGVLHHHSCAKAAAEVLKDQYPGEVALYCGKEKRDEERILRGEARIIVATSALSMGLDLPDVERVVHLQMPLSLADYYQMAGRAVRTGRRPTAC